MYALIQDGRIVSVGPLPTKAYANGRYYDLRDRDPENIAAAGYAPIVTEPRPADTATTTWDRVYPALIDGVPTVQWAERDKTPEELEAEQIDANEQDIQAKMLAALDSNQTFLDRANPTNAQILEQVRRMTRQLNGLIRVTGRHLTDISDT